MQLARLPFVEHHRVGRGDARRHLRLFDEGRFGCVVGHHGLHLEVHRHFFIDSSRSLLARLRRLLLLVVPHGFRVLLAAQRLVVSCFLDYGRNAWELLLVCPGLILGLGQRYLTCRPLEASRLPHARRCYVLRLGRTDGVDIAPLSARWVTPLDAIHLVLRGYFLHLLARGGLVANRNGLRSRAVGLFLQVVLLEVHQRRRPSSNPLVHELVALLLLTLPLRIIQFLAHLLGPPQTLRFLQ